MTSDEEPGRTDQPADISADEPAASGSAADRVADGSADESAASDPSAPSAGSAAIVRRRWRRAGRRLPGPLRQLMWIAAVALIGAAPGWALAPATSAEVGPLAMQVRASLAAGGSTVIQLPPVGNVTFDTHDGPLGFELSVQSIDLEAGQRLLDSPDGLTDLQDEAAAVARRAVSRAVVVSVGCAMLGAGLVGALVYRNPRRAVHCALAPLVPAAVAVTVAAATFHPASLLEPSFNGLLSRAPYISNRTVSGVDRFEAYREGVADLTRSVTTLYATANQLPVLAPTPEGVTTVLHVSDIHLNPQSFDLIANLTTQFRVDAVIDTGDITTWGSGLESSTLAPIGRLGVPYVFIRGNHDSGQTADAVAAQPGAIVLDNSIAEVAGLRIAGIGDPTFTPDGTGEGQVAELNRQAGTTLAGTIIDSARQDEVVDIALMHNPHGAEPLMGTVPLVLAGHLHSRSARGEHGTRLMVEGSTGGAGVSSGALRRLEQGEPIPLQATVLYFADQPDGRKRLVAYDQVSVGGLGLASVSVERTVVSPDEEPPEGALPDVTPVATTPGEPSESEPADPDQGDPEQGAPEQADPDQGDPEPAATDSPSPAQPTP